MAVMVRAAGRAGPGRPRLHAGLSCSTTAAGSITSDDAHAWVEVYFQSLGWVPFDPTPISADRAVAPALGSPGRRPDRRRQRRGPAGPGSADRGRADHPHGPRRRRGAGRAGRRGRPRGRRGRCWPAAAWSWCWLLVVGRPPAVRVLQRRRRLAAGTAGGAVGRAGGHRARPRPAAGAVLDAPARGAGAGGARRDAGGDPSGRAADAVTRLARAEEAACYGPAGRDAPGPELVAALRHGARAGCCARRPATPGCAPGCGRRRW